MITFFKNSSHYYAVESREKPGRDDIEKLKWLLGDADCIAGTALEGAFCGPRREMITPWSTNAVEITQNMDIQNILRIEEFTMLHSPDRERPGEEPFDPMLQQIYNGLDQKIFLIEKMPDPVVYISDLISYNRQEGLALSEEEIGYLTGLSKKLGRPLTDSEVFGFSQVNSEHCRHKIFNGVFIIDGREMPESLFSLIKKTAKNNPSLLVSAYKDNVAFIKGPLIEQFAPYRQDIADYFRIRDIQSVISLKAETHNFPTTVEPFNGAATGSGGEIRDRMAGGKGSIPMAGTAVYMTSYPRLNQERPWESVFPARKWLYKNPEEILIKASNGASDFGNKFGQPVICGSVLTFEHFTEDRKYGYDKVIMLAGGVGYAKAGDSLKSSPEAGQPIVILGGDNYRIGMGGGAVSSVATGEYGNSIELNAVQRSNPEMQKRVFNAIRAMAELDTNPIVSVHDHGAGGHLNSISELVEETGGIVHIDALPIGDPTLSDKEIISNESQERMGLVIDQEHAGLLQTVAERERAPFYLAGKTTGDHRFVFEDRRDGSKPIDLRVEDFFGKPPKTILSDDTVHNDYLPLVYDPGKVEEYLDRVLQLESVACKDWLTNKVDRAVGGKIAMQQTCGVIQLPLNNLGATALDHKGEKGIATSLGHAPAAGLIDPGAGSRLSVAEALTNLVWAPLTHGLHGVSLSANWMWPCKNPGEDARLYTAVKAISDFAIALNVNIPTGKDSLSMTQKYADGTVVCSPGTVIVSAVAEVTDVKNIAGPVLADDPDSVLVFIDFSGESRKLGGSSFAQVMNQLGDEVPLIEDSAHFIKAFNAVQQMIGEKVILAGHDISAGGLITTLLEMTFANSVGGIDADLTKLGESDIVKLLFSENPGVIVQIKNSEIARWKDKVNAVVIGKLSRERVLTIRNGNRKYRFDIDQLRDTWFRTSYLLDRKQCGEKFALDRFTNYKKQPLDLKFPSNFQGKTSTLGIDPHRRNRTGIKAAIIREKGVNRDRDMAYALYTAGFDVKDIHMTDLVSGRENLEDVSLIAFVGGFSNSDVLGSAKGWAGAFKYNEKAKTALYNFFQRKDTLSLGVCNGCQLLVELGLIYPDHPIQPKMTWNESHKFECTFVGLEIMDNNSVMLKTLSGSRLGIWIAHGEGKFNFPLSESNYHIPAKFRYSDYPGNPNGSQFDAAAIVSADGRHLAIMPHLEDSVFPWQWAYYPPNRKNDEITPWIEAFVNARKWVEEKMT